MDTSYSRYKGFEILPRTRRRSDTGRWTTQTYLFHLNTVQRFSCSNTFSTREEAIARCVDFGRRIIDGEVASLADCDLP